MSNNFEDIENAIIKCNLLLLEYSKALGKEEFNIKKLVDEIENLDKLIKNEIDTEKYGWAEIYQKQCINALSYIGKNDKNNMSLCLINRAYIIPYLTEYKKRLDNA